MNQTGLADMPAANMQANIILGQKIQWQMLSQYLVSMLADTSWISLLSAVQGDTPDFKWWG